MAGDFQFIPINTPNDAKDRAKRRLARSHAVKRALGNKRRQQQLSGDIFAKTTAGHHHSEKKSQERRAVPPLSLLTGIFDPFQALAVDSSRLQVLLGDCKAAPPRPIRWH
jgi:hypothetical protein